ncbi:hypothetical protein [Azoarcus sp. KH32C]
MTEHALPFYDGNEIALFARAFRERLPLVIKAPTGCEEKAA